MLETTTLIAAGAALAVGGVAGFLARGGSNKPVAQPIDSASAAQLQSVVSDRDAIAARLATTENQLRQAQTELASVNAAPAADDQIRALSQDANALRAQLAQSERALMETRRTMGAEIEALKAQPAPTAPASAPAASDAADERMRALAEDADALRSRLAQTEQALSELRRRSASEIAALKAQSAPTAVPAPVAATADDRARALTEDANALRARLAQAERALSEKRRTAAAEVAALKAQISATPAPVSPAPAAAAPVAPPPAASADHPAKERARALTEDLKSMRYRAMIAERALRRLRVAKG